MTKYEMQAQMIKIQKEYEEQRNKDLDIIIQKLFEHPIAQNDTHYQFLKEIEKDLRNYKSNYNL